MTATSCNFWVISPKTNPNARLRLFCFPYAGCGASIFRPWVDKFPAAIEVCLVQLPGRESRLQETLFTRLGALLPTLYVYSSEALLDCPISAFGGWQDREASPSALAAWRNQTNNCFVLRMFSGNHFFLHAARSPIVSAVAQDLRQLCIF